MIIKPRGDGLFQQLSKLMSSPNLAEGVSISEVLNAYPLWDVSSISFNSGSPPKSIIASWGDSLKFPGGFNLYLHPVPSKLVRTEHVAASANNAPYTKAVISSEDDILRWLHDFPTLRPLISTTNVSYLQRTEIFNPGSEWGLFLELPPWAALTREQRFSIFDLTVHPKWEHTPKGLISTPLEGCDEPIKPLMAAWLTFYGLSMLCRYYPAQWLNMLDVDTSSIAVPLEEVLDSDSDTVPSLILSALLQEDPARLRTGSVDNE